MKYFSKVRITDGKMDETIFTRDNEAVHAGNVKFASVLEYGAKGDGTTDDTTAISNAINSGLPVYFPVGRYLVSSPITPATAGQMFFGAGWGSVIVFSGESAINCNGVARIYITNLAIEEDNANRESGYAISNMTGQYSFVHRVHIASYNGIEHGANSGIVSDCGIHCVNNGIKIYNGDNTETIENCIIGSYAWSGTPDNGNGILVETGACANLKNVSTLLKGNGVKFTGEFVSFNAIQCWFDSCTNGIFFANGSHTNRTRINNCWFSSRAVDILLHGSVDGIWFDNCEFYKAGQAAVQTIAAANVNNFNVSNCLFCCQPGGGGIGLYESGGTNILINNNNFSTYEGGANYNVAIAVNENTTGIISGNCFRGVTTPVFGAGANITVANNAV